MGRQSPDDEPAELLRERGYDLPADAVAGVVNMPDKTGAASPPNTPNPSRYRLSRRPRRYSHNFPTLTAADSRASPPAGAIMSRRATEIADGAHWRQVQLW